MESSTLSLSKKEREPKAFNDDSFFLNTTESCWIARLGKNRQKQISLKPFVLAGGDILEVGDTFTKIDERGSAGNQPITLTSPWIQRYEGIATLPDNDPWYPNREMVLFSAFVPNETERFVFTNSEPDGLGVDEGYYMAYLRFGEGELFYIRGGAGTSCVVKCQSITRYP
ncbi:hypothetical protein ACSTK8_24110 [Vibrio parahaemolyticus]